MKAQITRVPMKNPVTQKLRNVVMVMLIPGFLSGFAQGVFNNDRNGNLPSFGVLSAIQDGAAGQEIAQVAQNIGGQPLMILVIVGC